MPIAFNIPLATELPPSQTHFVKNGKETVIDQTSGEPVEVDSTACVGTADEPTAEPGHLCVYDSGVGGYFAISGEIASSFINPGGGNGANAAGTVVRLTILKGSAASIQGLGTWAVTAEE